MTSSTSTIARLWGRQSWWFDRPALGPLGQSNLATRRRNSELATRHRREGLARSQLGRSESAPRCGYRRFALLACRLSSDRRQLVDRVNAAFDQITARYAGGGAAGGGGSTRTGLRAAVSGGGSAGGGISPSFGYSAPRLSLGLGAGVGARLRTRSLVRRGRIGGGLRTRRLLRARLGGQRSRSLRSSRLRRLV